MTIRSSISMAVAAACLALCILPASAQTGKAIPRLSNGKPDFSGVWDKPRAQDMSKSNPGPGCGSGTMGCKQTGAGELPFTAWGKEKFSKHDLDIEKYDPGVHCLPEGYVRSWGT